MSRVVLGFSGGVDSAVSSVLLKNAGHEVLGLYLDNGSAEARYETIAAAQSMGIELAVADIHSELDALVATPFAESYLRGETPNPCILCNPRLKFRHLLQYADSVGAEHIATGHYARADGGGIFKGRPSNDQSYMLCRLTREQARRLILPLGELEKAQTRALARELSLPAAQKPDSMEICFIPDKDYIGWLSRRTVLPPRGALIFHGEVIGEHDGIYRYTVGQRRPGLIDGRKVYYSRLDPLSNTVELALWEELFSTEVFARDFSWLIDTPQAPFRASVRVRHTKWENPLCTVYPCSEHVRIVCDEPVRAPAAGQSAVLYDGERLLGGGFITRR